MRGTRLQAIVKAVLTRQEQANKDGSGSPVEGTVLCFALVTNGTRSLHFLTAVSSEDTRV